jgi:hypothetical protein
MANHNFSVECRLKEMGSSHEIQWNFDYQNSLCNTRMQEQILDILQVLQLVQVPSVLLNTMHYKYSSSIPIVIIQSVYELISHCAPARFAPVSGFCDSEPKDLQERSYSQMNSASLGLGPPMFRTNICGQMKILMLFAVITSKESFHQPGGWNFS